MSGNGSRSIGPNGMETILDVGADAIVPSCRVRRTTDFTHAVANTWYPVTWDAEDWDTDNIHDTVTNTSRFTCRTAGLYHFVGQAQGNSSYSQFARVKKNGGGNVLAHSSNNPAPNYIAAIVISGYVQMVVGDYIEMESASGNAAGHLESDQGAFSAPDNITPAAFYFDFVRLGPSLVVSSSGGGNAKVATTVAGLGTPTDGKIGFIRAGSTPFNFVQVIYDATSAKWVSAETWEELNSPASPDQFQLITQGITLSNTHLVQLAWRPWKVLDTAGLIPQVSLITEGLTGAGGGGNLTVTAYYQGADNSTSPSATVATTCQNVHANNTWRVLRAAWTQITAGYTVKDYIRPDAVTAASASSCTLMACSYGMRSVG